jgi:hypothetical protein
MGLISGEATATTGMEVTVTHADGTIAYNKFINRQYILTGVEIGGEDNAQKALDEAMKDCISKLFGDTGFVNSLLKSSLTSGSTTRHYCFVVIVHRRTPLFPLTPSTKTAIEFRR